MSSHGLHTGCRGRAGVRAHTQKCCFCAIAQLWELEPCRRTACLWLQWVPGYQRISVCVRGEGCSQLRAAQARRWLSQVCTWDNSSETKAKKLKHRSFIQRPMNKISVSDLICELFLHFLAIQGYVSKYQLAWSGIAVETSFFHLSVLHFLWIPLFSLCQEAA